MASESTHSRPRGAAEIHAETEPGVTLDPVGAKTDHPGETSCLSPATRARLYSVDRTILEARIDALEQALETQHRQRTEIIDRYEHILTERERDDAVAIEIEAESEQQNRLAGRLRELLTGQK